MVLLVVATDNVLDEVARRPIIDPIVRKRDFHLEMHASLISCKQKEKYDADAFVQLRFLVL